MRNFVVTLILTLLLAVPSWAQPTDPRTLPLLQPGSLVYLGQFKVPDTDGTGWQPNNQFTWSYNGVVGMAGPGLVAFGCHAQVNASLGVVEVPAIGGTAKVIEPCRQMPNYQALGADPSTKHIGGAWNFGGRMVVDALIYYDGGHSQVATHWYGPSLTTMNGPVLVQAQNVTLGADKHFPKAGMMPGWMGPIPAEWQPILGGPAFTGQGALAITARTSYGPSFSVFDPAQFGVSSPVKATMLIGYPDEHQTLGAWGPVGGPWRGPKTTIYYNGADRLAGMFFANGTRSVISIGRHGTAMPEMKGEICYGPGTSDPALVDQPDGQGNHYCFDPSNSNKGPHSYRYVDQAMAYDANDLEQVKLGKLQPWDVKPYAVWAFGAGTPLDRPNVEITGATYDPTTNRLYVSAGWTDVYVFDVKAGTPPPTDVDCVESAGPWSSWTPSADGKTESRSRTWTQTTAKSGNGKACVWTATSNPATETETRDIPPQDPCKTDPVLLSGIAWPGVGEGSRSGRIVWSVANSVVTLKSILWNYNPQSVTVTDSRGCSATSKKP